LEVSASSPEHGEAKEFVEARYDQEGLQIGFNAEYLLEFLGAVGTASTRMQVRTLEVLLTSVPPEMTPSTTDRC
jgi:DNA polymerase III sliding clamp (beta) subunit (PCNA family)